MLYSVFLLSWETSGSHDQFLATADKLESSLWDIRLWNLERLREFPRGRERRGDRKGGKEIGKRKCASQEPVEGYKASGYKVELLLMDKESYSSAPVSLED